ncbi:uncharacterized protein LOC132562782 [Ylistrum balloti]|uniref:uncharacterized protein LOC132562782 n=1 Tax=Ylistrum balloti TaxID=509963 RepID=UPI0029059383|nr:uncharacterized protein LOC132562782 [Ylistrum balloti]
MDGNQVRGKTSYRQFEYCSFCRTNHKKGKKHLYSTKHRTIIQNILDKTRKKIIAATDTLTAPEVEPLGRSDMKQNFWCYFCVAEIARHQTLDVCLLKFGSLLEHIASENHTKKTADFFRAHRVDESVYGRDLYCLSPDKLKTFQMLTIQEVRKFEERDKHLNKLIARKLRDQETKRKIISQSEDWKTVKQEQQFSEARNPSSVYTSDHLTHSDQSGVSTLSAHGDGMTFIGPQDFIVEEGNVHTGGLPPWLQDNSEDTDQEIGPTLKDFQRHVANEQKKKLPSCRVGASFDRNSAKSDSWLPSFGQVWNSGRRLNSKKYFERETKNLTPIGRRLMSGPETSSSDGKDIHIGHTSHQMIPTNVVPYRSKRLKDASGQDLNNTSQKDLTTGCFGALTQSGLDDSKSVNNGINNDRYGGRNTMLTVGIHLPSRYIPKTDKNNEEYKHKEGTSLLQYPSQQEYTDRGTSQYYRQGNQDRLQVGYSHNIEKPYQNYRNNSIEENHGSNNSKQYHGNDNSKQNHGNDSSKPYHGNNNRKRYHGNDNNGQTSDNSQNIGRELSNQAYKRKRSRPGLQVSETISKCDGAFQNIGSLPVKTNFISTPLLDNK